MKFNLENINRIQEALAGDLPGITAHKLMAPYQRKTAQKAIEDKESYREAAIMMLLYPKDEEMYFALMLRPNYDGVHGGQVSFPGGKREKGESDAENALREMEEEVGIDRNKVQVIGKLTDVFIPPSKMLVNPFVGFIDYEPEFVPDAIEVEKILEVPLKELFSDDIIKDKKVQVNKGNETPMFIKVPYYELQLNTVWGATALMLSEFRMAMKT